MANTNQVKAQVTVLHKRGLHLRCASELMKIAAGFKSQISITKGRKTATLLSALDIIALSASPGTPLTITATGEDAQAALDAVVNFFNNPQE